jgi:hypothetical protein
MAFHAGLVVVLAGVVLSATGRFTGEAVLVEGFPLEAVPETFLRAEPPAALAALRGVRLGVSDVAATYAEGDRLVDVSAVLHVERRGRPPERQFVSVNVPVDVGPFQLTLHAYGFAPEVVATDPAGRVRAEGTLALRLLPPGTEDSLVLDDGELRFRLFPAGDPAARGGGSPVPSRPVLAFRWYQRGALVAAGRVEPGGEAIAAGYRVRFPRFVYWADLLVGRDPGVPWFTAGALLGIAGLALRLAFHERTAEVEVVPAGDAVEVRLTVSARWFPALLRERADRAAAFLEG